MGNTQKKRLAGAAVIVMSALVLSRVTGFLRSTFIPNIISTKWQTDAFNMSFRITDFMYNLLVGGAISAALIPVLSGYLAKGEEEDGWKAIGTFFNITFIAMAAVSILGIIFSPQIVDLMAPKFDIRTKALTVTLTRILFPSVVFIMLAGLANGVLNAYQRFAAAAYGPSIYNFGCALSIFFLGKYGVEKVVIGIMCSAGVYFLFQLSYVVKNMKYYRFKLFLRHPGFIKLYKLAIPSLVASSIYQVNILISSYFTGLLKEGSVTSYSMANDVWQMPFGIFAVGIGTAILPALSEKSALGETHEYKSVLLKGLKSVCFFTIPSAVAFVVLSKPIISGIFKWTVKVDASLITKTSSILMCFALAVVVHSMLAIINRAYYALNDTKTPLYTGASTIIMTVMLNYIFLNFTQLDAAGMSLSYSIAGVVNMIVLTLILNKRINGMGLEKLIPFSIKVLIAATIMGVALYFINSVLPVNYTGAFETAAKAKELFYLTVEIIAGVLLYFGAVLLMGVDEAYYAIGIVKSKIKGINMQAKKFFCKIR